MKRTTFIALFFSLMFGTQAIAQNDSEKEKNLLLLKIAGLIDKQDNKEAYKEANAGVGKFPNEPLFYLYRGRAVTDLTRKMNQTIYDMPDEKYKMALSDFNKAIELNGDLLNSPFI